MFPSDLSLAGDLLAGDGTSSIDHISPLDIRYAVSIEKTKETALLLALGMTGG